MRRFSSKVSVLMAMGLLLSGCTIYEVPGPPPVIYSGGGDNTAPMLPLTPATPSQPISPVTPITPPPVIHPPGYIPYHPPFVPINPVHPNVTPITPTPPVHPNITPFTPPPAKPVPPVSPILVKPTKKTTADLMLDSKS
jgi:hypothetical protein